MTDETQGETNGQAEYGAELSFLGAGYPNRQRAFARLAELGLKFKIFNCRGSGGDESHLHS